MALSMLLLFILSEGFDLPPSFPDDDGGPSFPDDDGGLSFPDDAGGPSFSDDPGSLSFHDDTGGPSFPDDAGGPSFPDDAGGISFPDDDGGLSFLLPESRNFGPLELASLLFARSPAKVDAIKGDPEAGLPDFSWCKGGKLYQTAIKYTKLAPGANPTTSKFTTITSALL
jgi:hypothetical protein